MTENSSNRPPIWFWVVSVIALIWNLMGVMAYLGQAFMSEDILNSMPEAEQALYKDIPAWATAAFAFAVWGGALGCLALLFRKKWAKPMLVISLLGIVVQMVYNLFMSNASEVYGPEGAIMPIMLLVIGVFLVWFSRKSHNEGWLT